MIIKKPKPHIHGIGWVFQQSKTNKTNSVRLSCFALLCFALFVLFLHKPWQCGHWTSTKSHLYSRWCFMVSSAPCHGQPNSLYKGHTTRTCAKMRESGGFTSLTILIGAVGNLQVGQSGLACRSKHLLQNRWPHAVWTGLLRTLMQIAHLHSSGRLFSSAAVIVSVSVSWALNNTLSSPMLNCVKKKTPMLG